MFSFAGHEKRSKELTLSAGLGAVFVDLTLRIFAKMKEEHASSKFMLREGVIILGVMIGSVGMMCWVF